jgi:transcription initiation factor IIE alpha subunit
MVGLNKCRVGGSLGHQRKRVLQKLFSAINQQHGNAFYACTNNKNPSLEHGNTLYALFVTRLPQ